MQIPKLKTIGTCSVCKNAVEIVTSAIISNVAAEHHSGRNRCKGSNYSAWNPFYVIETAADAREVALFMRSDTGVCLASPSAGCHSMSCNDGRFCQEERSRLSRAFAVYFLKKHNRNKKAA